jgi:hypothetical protein
MSFIGFMFFCQKFGECRAQITPLSPYSLDVFQRRLQFVARRWLMHFKCGISVAKMLVLINKGEI